MRLTLTRKVTRDALIYLAVVAFFGGFTMYGLLSSIAASNYLANYAFERANLGKQFDTHLTRAVAEAQMYLHTRSANDRAEAERAVADAGACVAALARLHQQHTHDTPTVYAENIALHGQREALLQRGQQQVQHAIAAVERNDAAAIAQAGTALEQFEHETEAFHQHADTVINTWMAAAIGRVQWLDQIRLIMTPVTFATFAIMAGVVIVRIRRVLVQPINTLAYAASAVADGNLSPTVPVTNTDELGELQRAFNHMVGSLREQAHAQQRLQGELQHRALYDQLTHLPNRTLFIDRLGQALAVTRRHGGSVAVLFLDLDNFKIVNDSLGHNSGDRLLMAVAERLRVVVRPEDTVARFGGDEFAVLLEQVASAADAIVVAERIEQQLCAPVVLDGHQVRPEASIGIALSSSSDTAAEDVLRDADIAMYHAKHHGQARYEVFDPRMKAYAVERLQLESDLRRALEEHQLYLHYQPIVSLGDAAIIGVEALVRWQHPQRGTISPGVFIPLAEETGLIVPLGQWVLETACRQAQRWIAAFGSRAPQFVSVNLSARQFADAQLPTMVADALERSGLHAAALELELTESVVMENGATTLGMLAALKQLGVRLAIDDFGTGYSSLAYLKRFPIDTLKIDRSFVERLGSDTENTAIVRAIVSLAHTLNIDVTAEGIETAEQAHLLHLLGCAYGQGFHFAKPQPGAAIEALFVPPTPALTTTSVPQIAPA